MSVYFVNSPTDIKNNTVIEQQIRTAIPDLITVTGIEDVIGDDSGHQTYVLMTAPPSERRDIGGIIEAISRHRGFLILINDDISASDYKRLVRTGAAEWVSANAVPQEIVDIIARQRAGNQTSTARRAEPVVVSFVPSAGGVGNTTVVVEMAIQLKAQKQSANRRICIVDLDFQSSHMCDHLDIEPRLQIQEISANPERLDDQLFNIFISPHSSGVDVFAAPRSKFNVCDLNVAALQKLFDMIAARYDLVVIDLPVTWFPWLFQVIAGSDGVVVTGINTIPGLRQISETLVAVRDACRTTCQIAVAVNRCEHRLVGGLARRHHVEKVLGREKVFYVRNDSMVIQSVNSGTPMALANAARKVNKEIASIGTFCGSLKSSRLPSLG